MLDRIAVQDPHAPGVSSHGAKQGGHRLIEYLASKGVVEEDDGHVVGKVEGEHVGADELDLAATPPRPAPLHVFDGDCVQRGRQLDADHPLERVLGGAQNGPAHARAKIDEDILGGDRAFWQGLLQGPPSRRLIVEETLVGVAEILAWNPVGGLDAKTPLEHKGSKEAA